MIVHRRHVVSSKVSTNYCVAVRVASACVVGVHLPSRAGDVDFDAAVSETQAALNKISSYRKSGADLKCEMCVVAGDFNTRFQWQVENVIGPCAVDPGHSYQSRRNHVHRSETLSLFAVHNSLKNMSSYHELGKTRHEWQGTMEE
eukprot:2187699-Karenia_brevis.AAC.1